MSDNGFRSLRRAALDTSAEPDHEMADPLAELARLIGQNDPHDNDPHATVSPNDDAAGGYGKAPPPRPRDWAGEEWPAREPVPAARPARDHAPAARHYSPTLFEDALRADAFREEASGDEARRSNAPRVDAPYGDAQHDDAQHDDAQYGGFRHAIGDTGAAAAHDQVHDRDDYGAGADGSADDGYADEGYAEDDCAEDGYTEDGYADAGVGHDGGVPAGDRYRAAHAETYRAAHAQSYRQSPATEGFYGEERHGSDDGAEGDDVGDYSAAGYDEGYDAPLEEDQPGRRRRRSSSLVVGVVGLVVLGSAGAFGYRALFSGAMFPALPPIIKPSGTPIKIVPSHESQAAAASQTAGAEGNAGEHLVSHQEQPVDVQANAGAPHGGANGVTNVPVVSNTPADGAFPETQPPVASAAQAPDADAPAAAPPRPVQTLAIHGGRAGHPGTAGARAPRATRTADAGGPMAIAPDGGAATAPAAPRRTSEASAEEPSASLSAGSVTGSTGGYAVQISSQRSQADAQTSLNALQAKYPQQLGGQHGMIRRADLGAKGIYYRALVGPFATAAEASHLCGSLKAAGGSCIIQRR